MRALNLSLVLAIVVCGSTACSKRQLGPTLLAGGGAGLMVSGVAYRASFHDEEDAGLLGRTSEQQAVTATLLFSGLALIVAGVIWSATTPVCETNNDCWIGDVCEPATHTCVAAPAIAPSAPATSQATLAPRPALLLAPLRPDRFVLEVGASHAELSRWPLVAP